MRLLKCACHDRGEAWFASLEKREDGTLFTISFANGLDSCILEFMLDHFSRQNKCQIPPSGNIAQEISTISVLDCCGIDCTDLFHW